MVHMFIGGPSRALEQACVLCATVAAVGLRGICEGSLMMHVLFYASVPSEAGNR